MQLKVLEDRHKTATAFFVASLLLTRIRHNQSLVPLLHQYAAWRLAYYTETQAFRKRDACVFRCIKSIFGFYSLILILLPTSVQDDEEKKISTTNWNI